MDFDSGSGASEPRLLARASWTVDELDDAHPTRWLSDNKRFVIDQVRAQRTVDEGVVKVSRWNRPERLPHFVEMGGIDVRPGLLDYPAAGDGSGSSHWHLNFADPHLFAASSGPLLAQDEHQVLEHPRLASVAEAMESASTRSPKMNRRTVDDGRPTPILIEGAPRECTLDTSRGLYGNAFARASYTEVGECLRILSPPTRSNIVAVSALEPRSGPYTQEQIQWLFEAAFTAFRAAVVVSTGAVVMHTGFWGCGVFGGNRTLLPTLQFLAAGTAGVERLIFWTGGSMKSVARAQRAVAVARGLNGLETDEALSRLVSMGFEWGVGDGN
jgi:hypothetical protein